MAQLSAPIHRKLTVAISTVISLLALAIPSVARASDLSDQFTSALNKGPIYAAFAALVGGFLTSLTPCVYPMIAITVSVFGARQTKSRREAILLSTVFVLGIAAMFTPLGLVAGLTGSIFGSALANRWVIASIALIFIALSGSMFGLFEFMLPSKLVNRLSTMGGIGYGGAFVLGIISGVIAAPCTGPVLTGILIWIGKTQNPWLGAAALFAFSLGLGFPFWIVGTFAIRLPKSGKWMLGIKSFFGIVLAIVALYFLEIAFPKLVRALPLDNYIVISAAIIAAIGIAIGAIHLTFDEGRAKTIRKTIGIILTIAGAIVCITWLDRPASPPPGVWIHDEPQAVAAAKSQSKPLFIDFTADWCIACKRLARETFPDPSVKEELERFILLEVDASVADDPGILEIHKRYGVVGLPTLILIGSDGTEAKRFTDFMPPPELLRELQSVK
ncbi:MAG: thioredoxin family protein [Polyangiaceae bacterium]|nr:thioredoxin family protein [Polyangiaceae bacterium]